MKKFLAFLTAFILVFSLAACGSNQGTEQPEQESANGEVKTYKIGYAFNAVDENTQRSLTGWENAVEEWNAAHDDIKIEFFYTDGKSSVETQLANVETMLLEQPDLIILASCDTTGCIPAAEAIHEAGVFCLETRGMESDAVDLRWKGFDEPSMSQLNAIYYEQYLEADPNNTLNAVIVLGNPAQENQLHRADGFRELAEKYPDRVNILDENYANWDTDQAQKLMEDWIQLYGKDINAAVVASDAMALGVINALEAAGFNAGDVIITAVDGTKAGLDQVESGWQTATVKMLMSSQAKGQLEMCVKCLEGEYTDPTFNGGSVYAVAVDAANVAEYRNVD